MNARESMQALLDGKTIRRRGNTITLTDWGLSIKCGESTWGRFMLEDSEIVEEYPLTFEQALREMLDGKIVMCEESERYAYRFRNGVFEDSRYWDYYPRWEKCVIFAPLQKSKWKVVE